MSIGDQIPDVEALLVWMRANAHLPEQAQISFSIYKYDDDKSSQKIFMQSIARSLPKLEKSYDSWSFDLRTTFGSVNFLASCYRDAVCTKTVIGKYTVEAIAVPAHEEEIVTWECHPLLDNGGTNATAKR